MKTRDVIKIVEQDGWLHVRTTGSHRHNKHPSKKGLGAVPGNLVKDMPEGTRNSIFKQAGIK